MLRRMSATLRALPRHLPEATLSALFALLFLAWSWLTLTGCTSILDAHARPPILRPRSYPGQIAEALSLVTHPVVIVIAIAVVAIFSFRRRMRRLSLALAIAAAGIPLQVGLALATHRPRPHTAFADSISHIGSAYPASHVTAMTLGAWVLVTLTRAHRRGTSSVAQWTTIGSGAVVLTAACQWIMGLAHLSDIVGGLLLGIAVANLALSAGGVDSILSAWARLELLRQSEGKRAAIILNPTKFDDLSLLRRRVEAEARTAGWRPTLWLETTIDDPGHEPTRRALGLGVDLVLVAGGDGTVRAVSAELAGTGTPMALLPSGTGNLLARNLGVPLDTDAALQLALHGRPRAIDVVRCETDGPDGDGVLTQRFVVMAGIGLDAQIMENTSDDLKKVIRSGAYALAAVQNAAPNPFTATVTLDDDEPTEQQAVMALLGNVGTITAGVPLFPQASPSDGKVDLMLANPDRVVDWARLGAQILTGRDQEGFTTTSASRVRIATDRPVPFELDGDTVGTTRSLTVEIEPGALLVVAPRH